MPLPQRPDQQPIHKPQPARLRVGRVLADVFGHVRVLVVVDADAAVAGARGQVLDQGGLAGGGWALCVCVWCVCVFV